MPYIYRYRQGRFEQGEVPVVEEQPLTLLVNGEELATLMATPVKLEALVLGFLYFERLIGGMKDVRSLHVDAQEGLADVELRIPLRRPEERVLTSGCTGGISFHLSLSEYPPIQSNLRLRPERVLSLMRLLYGSAKLYQRSRGIHAAALCEEQDLLICAEDVGRHNALDKILGEALLRGVPTQGKILLSSGRISSEMLRKGARMQVPFIISRTSPTTLAVEGAKRLGMTLIGYARNDSFNVYSHPERIDYKRPSAIQVVLKETP